VARVLHAGHRDIDGHSLARSLPPNSLSATVSGSSQSRSQPPQSCGVHGHRSVDAPTSSSSSVVGATTRLLRLELFVVGSGGKWHGELPREGERSVVRRRRTRM